MGACHICFAEYELEKLWQVKIEKIDEVVHLCRACLIDVYAIKWVDVEPD